MSRFLAGHFLTQCVAPLNYNVILGLSILV